MALIKSCDICAGGEGFDNVDAVHPSAGIDLSACGNSFTLSTDKQLTSVEFYCKALGNPVGIIRAKLYLGVIDGVTGRYKPDDSPADSGILAESDDFTLEELDGLYRWRSFTFSGGNKYHLQSGVIYIIQIVIISATTLNATNRLHVWGGTDPTCCTGNESAYRNSAWESFAYDVWFRLYGDDWGSTGWQSEVIRQLESQLRTCILEGTVSGDWRITTRSLVRHLPYINVKFKPEFWIDIYDRNIGSLEGSGTLSDYPFSLHIFHSNCMESGEEKGKYAQDVASRVITCLTQSPVSVGADIYNLTARESEPTAGAHRISRCIVEGRIQIKRIG